MADETPVPLSNGEIAEIADEVADDMGYFEVPNSFVRRLLATLAMYRGVVLAVATTEREDDIPGDPNSTRIPVALVDRARTLCPQWEKGE